MSADALRVDGRAIVKRDMFNGNGAHVGFVRDSAIFDLRAIGVTHSTSRRFTGLPGELIGHLNEARVSEIRLDRANNRLFGKARDRTGC